MRSGFMPASRSLASSYAARVLVMALGALKTAPTGIRLASLLTNMLSLVLPLAISQVYDRIIPNHSNETLLALGLLVCAAIIIETLLDDLRNSIVSREAMGVARAVQQEAVTRLFSCPPASLRGESPSRIVDRLQALQAVAEWRGGSAHFALLDLPFAFLFLAMVFMVGGVLVLVPLAVMVVMGLVAGRRTAQMRAANAARDREDMKLHDFLVETFRAISTVKAGAMEPLMERRFERLQDSIARQNYHLCTISDDTQADATLLSNLMQLATVTFGAVLVIHGGLSIGSLACCVMLAGRAARPILRCVSYWTDIQSIAVNLEKAQAILALPAAAPPVMASLPAAPISVQIEALALPTLAGREEGLSADLPAGSITLISGADGSGKSTLIDMIAGLAAPVKGVIRLDGLDPVSRRAAFKPRIVIVRPGHAIFKGSILDNITNFRTGDAIESALFAADLIGLDRDIALLPQGYETPMGDGGQSEFPVGFIQRLVIARGLARHPDMLILDEADSGLDHISGQALAQGLKALRGHMTMVIASNHAALRAIAEHTLILDGASPSVPASSPGPQHSGAA